MKIAGIIPARYASSRFPGKPLALIDGISMIQRVYANVSRASSLTTVVVATDDKRIFEHVKAFGGRVVMTAPTHNSGTDRCLEALDILSDGGDTYDVVVNIQGDEPFIEPTQIDLLCSTFDNSEVQISTLATPITDQKELNAPHIVKAVIDKLGNALYFSRSPIPFVRNEKSGNSGMLFYKHIGLYAYRSDTLNAICACAPGKLEEAESLEQLRWLENGYRIHVEITEYESVAIDIPEDLLKANAYLKKKI